MSEVWNQAIAANQEGAENEDIWDDTELIKMYEQSINSTYTAVNARVASKQFVSDCGKTYNWKVGARCMAPYSEGEETAFYPAVIEWIGGGEDSNCGVVFVGYEGSVDVVDIKELWEESEQVEEDGQQASSTAVAGNKKKSKKDDKSKYNHSGPSRQSIPHIAPPVPPGVLNMVPPDEVEALSSMLMSWYMSGYHTGYYQALSDQKANRPNQ